jgi:hypothetical protein
MNQTTSIIRSFGYFLDGNWSTHGREAVVSSPYDHSVIAVVSEAGRDAVETALEAAVQAFAVTRKMASHQRATVLRKIVEGISARREEFARTICQEAGKPIKTARIGRGEHADLRRVHPARHHGIDHRPLGLDEALSARPGVRHHAVQLSPEPGGPQGGTGDCGGLPDHPEAGAADPNLCADAGRNSERSRLARGSTGGDAFVE